MFRRPLFLTVKPRPAVAWQWVPLARFASSRTVPITRTTTNLSQDQTESVVGTEHTKSTTWTTQVRSFRLYQDWQILAKGFEHTDEHDHACELFCCARLFESLVGKK